jgi:hypothetical protein
MTDTRTTLETTGAEVTTALTEAVDALRDCEATSTACAMAMAATGGMVAEIRRALDCADQSAATARILLRAQAPDEAVLNAVVEAAVVACEASAAECGPHADRHDHCRVHAQSASACATSLRALR